MLERLKENSEMWKTWKAIGVFAVACMVFGAASGFYTGLKFGAEKGRDDTLEELSVRLLRFFETCTRNTQDSEKGGSVATYESGDEKRTFAVQCAEVENAE